MTAFKELLEVSEILNSPNGCAWDNKQTFLTLQPCVIEEAHELIEAVDEDEDQKIIEELGDLFYIVIFYCKVAAKQGRFSLDDVIQKEKEKLIRRHPHIFGDVQVKDAEEVVKNWERIKKEEKNHSDRKSALDGIPKTLSLLIKAQKVMKRLKRADFPVELDSQDIGDQFLALIKKAEEQDVDAESALRRALQKQENDFRARENALQNNLE